MVTLPRSRAEILVVFGVLTLGYALMSGCAGVPAWQALAQSTNEPLPTPPSQATDRSSFEVPNDPPDTCPVTPPPNPPFTPPPPYSPKAPSAGYFWYGTDLLWTAVPRDGEWYGLPHNPEGYTQKLVWWRKGYDWRAEPQPKLTVTGRRLDAPAPLISVSGATNAFAEDIGSVMLIGVDFPTVGCWEVTGRYRGHELSFVVWIAP